jgi:hypothetical protein
MGGLHELWELMGALRTSLPFAIALPLLVGLVFASAVDWIERRLNAEREGTARDAADARVVVAGRLASRRLALARRHLIDAGDRGREHA